MNINSLDKEKKVQPIHKYVLVFILIGWSLLGSGSGRGENPDPIYARGVLNLNNLNESGSFSTKGSGSGSDFF